jgi:ABC-type multidrug transport system fused ATPase/permease subunit
MLFSGTMRYNLDTTGEHTDEEIWAALGRVQMKDKVAGAGGGLDAPVSEGGDNFSVGERQLLCTARALLRKARIVVLDEATASTDVLSDSIIQRMLRTEFPGVTMLIIAHRVNTILDADKILVLAGGAVVEFAPPSELLARPGSAFAELVRESAHGGGGGGAAGTAAEPGS